MHGNTTVWDFVITLKEDGTPFVEDRRNGTPSDAEYLAGSGGGGTHQTLKPTGGREMKVATP